MCSWRETRWVILIRFDAFHRLIALGNSCMQVYKGPMSLSLSKIREKSQKIILVNNIYVNNMLLE